MADTTFIDRATQIQASWLNDVNTVVYKMGVNVKSSPFNAQGNGTTDDTTAIQAMAAAIGYVYFERGSYLITTVTLDVPVYFAPGASLVVNSPNTVTFTNQIEAPRQFIFQGTGTYTLTNDGNSGENSRQVHASWFGAFPTSGTETDQAPAINRMCTAVGNLREAVLQFDQGRYSLGAQILVPRGAWFRGMGTRRTVFSMIADGFSALKTNGVGITFEDFQFELGTTFPGGVRTSPLIEISQADCEINDVWMGRSTRGVVISGDNARVKNITATYGAAPGANSSLVEVIGNTCDIDGVFALTSAFGPDQLVLVGGPNASGNKSNISVRNVKWVVPSIGVHLHAAVGTVGRITIESLTYSGLPGTNAALVFKTTTASTFSVQEVLVNGINANNAATNGIQFVQSSSGTTDNIVISNVIVDGSSGYGIDFTQTTGSFSNVFVSDSVDVRQRATPFQFSGTTSGVFVSPQITPSANTPISYDFTIADDGVASVNLRRQVFTGIVMITVANVEYGIFMTRAASTPANTSITASANMNSLNVALTGTTGTDGKFTLGVTSGALYFENRLGSTQRVSVSVLYGMQ